MAEYTKLPPGWDCRYDQSTGKCYYINYLTKAMQLEDPRIRYKQLQNERCSTESIPLQPLHGSPYHVYPTSTFPALRAFQGPSSHSISASPLLSTKSQQLQMEMSPILRPQSSSPQTPHLINALRRQTIQETSFTNPTETDAVVAKINNMFPTASENHIRLLLKKYYNREAVVISALQVEKNPITMPGPFTTPPSQRHLYHSNSAFQMTPPLKRFESFSRNDSPIPGRPPSSVASSILYGSPRFGEQIRSSPKPSSSPKMKLRYLKNVFPKADEMLLLDILANADNNVQKATETLLAMGYTKREVAAPPKISNRPSTSSDTRKNENSSSTGGDESKFIPLHPKIISAEDKAEVKARLQKQYKMIEERIIMMALESVNYSEDRASQILQIVQQENESKAKQQITAAEQNLITKSDTKETISKVGVKKRNSSKGSTEDECSPSMTKNGFKSIIGRIPVKGHNTELVKGPDDKILLADYITWNGANPNISLGRKGIASGSDPSLLTERNYTPIGHDSSLCKGSQAGLAKGSIYSQINQNITKNVKCN